VNWQHFRAFLWLRWRIRLNQMRRGGIANVVILVLLTGMLVLFAGGLFAGSFLAGLLLMGEAGPLTVLLVFDALVCLFLFSWATGVLTDLQRSESLSLDKVLHLPVSLANAFVINYFSSWFSLTLLLFVAGLVGLGLGMVFSQGPALLLLFPLLLGFLLMVTAVTYQFQGWLASLMTNPRRRRTVLVFVTMGFVLLAQLPNLVNLVIRPWAEEGKAPPPPPPSETRPIESGKGPQERPSSQEEAFRRQQDELLKKAQASSASEMKEIEEAARLINLVLPPGWLPLAVSSLRAGVLWPALLGTVGLSALGLVSLWRSYRTTVRFYTGQFTSGKRRARGTAAPAAAPPEPGNLLERSIPGVSERPSAVALAGLRSLLRGPEGKLMLLSPLILVVLFGTLWMSGARGSFPEAARPLLDLGGMAMILLTTIQLIGNQFGFDRAGFRVFVLSPIPRRDILLGKNLTFAMPILGLGALVTIGLQVAHPARIDHFLSAFLQSIAMYLLFCLPGNLLAILAPMPIAAGSLKPVNVKLLPILLQMVFLFVLPLILIPTLIPWGVEALLVYLGMDERVPVRLLLTLAEVVVVAGLYYLVLGWEGQLLQAREQKILEVVAARDE
jgi:hypothetical protein